MPNETPVQPKLGDLLARYLERQAEAHAAGVATEIGEVTPYEAGPVQPIDPKLAWDEARTALALEGRPVQTKAPPHWSTLVASHEPAVALAFCAGNFPQLVRNFHMILQHADLTALRPVPGRPVPAPELTEWAGQVAAKKQVPQMLLALGALRLAKQFGEAEQYAKDHDAAIPDDWRAAWENEKAALAWHMGKTEEARTIWESLPPTLPVLFNRGMADLFLDRIASARVNLEAAVANLPESSAWHHLGRLYLTLAAGRG